MKKDYDIFAEFYDVVMGDRKDKASYIAELIHKNHPKAKTILEVACGTGVMLKHLPKKFEKSGLDLSAGMLKVAKKTLPKAKFYQKSMTNFNLNKRYDVILCLFDSINHLLTFSDWEKAINNWYKHLNNGGVLIFDINTEKKLSDAPKQRTWIRHFGNDVLLMKVQEKEGVFNWRIRFFKQQKNDKYRLLEENIKEVSFPVKKILASLSNFKSIKIIDPTKTRPTKNSNRLYFIAKK